MSINPIASFNSANVSGTGFGGPVGGSHRHQVDPSKLLDQLVNRIFSQNDRDGDGDLNSQDLSKLSSDAFSKLDTDGDGKVSKNEIKGAIQKLQDAIKQAFENGGRQGVKDYHDSLQNTPEGELLKFFAPGGSRHGQPGQEPSASPSQTGTGQGGQSVFDVVV